MPDLPIITVIVFWPSLRGYQSAWEKQEGQEGTSCIEKRSNKNIIHTIKDNNLE